MTGQEIGPLIRRLREEAGLSQNALARAAGIDPTNLNRIERGRQGPPRQSTLLRIVRGLGLSLADARAQELLLAAGDTETPAPGVPQVALHEHGAGYGQLLAPTIRELRGVLFRALELVSVLEELGAGADGTTEGRNPHEE